MADTGKPARPALPGLARWLCGALASGLLAMLAVAAWITPDARGQGSHQQLGLPPCTFVVLFARPCPTCGSTTAWAHLVRGQLLDALRANAGGTLLAVLAIAGVFWLAGAAIRGKYLSTTPSSSTLAAALAGIAVIMLIQWGWRLLAQ